MCPEIQPDFSEAVDTLPEGTYKVRVTGAEIKTSKSGGQYVNWELQTFGQDNSALNDRKVWHITMISGKGSGMLRQFLKATGHTAEGNFDTDAILGRELEAVLYTDKEYGNTKVKTVKPLKESAAA